MTRLNFEMESGPLAHQDTGFVTVEEVVGDDEGREGPFFENKDTTVASVSLVSVKVL